MGFVCHLKKNYEDLIISVSEIVSFHWRKKKTKRFNLAHGEKWSTDEPKKLGASTTTLTSNRPPPYTNPNGVGANFARARGKAKRSSEVRLRSDISRGRPAYSRSQSQQENTAAQSQNDSPV